MKKIFIFLAICLINISAYNNDNISDKYYGMPTSLTDYFNIVTTEDYTEFLLSIEKKTIDEIDDLKKIIKSVNPIKLEATYLNPVIKKKKKKKNGIISKIKKFFSRKKENPLERNTPAPIIREEIKGELTSKAAVDKLSLLQGDYKDNKSKRLLPLKAFVDLLQEFNSNTFFINERIVRSIRTPRSNEEMELLLPLIQLPTYHKDPLIRRELIYKIVQGCDGRLKELKKINTICQTKIRALLLNIVAEGDKTDKYVKLAAERGLKTLDAIQFKFLYKFKLDFDSKLSGPVYDDKCKLPINSTEVGEQVAPTKCTENPYINTYYDKKLKVPQSFYSGYSRSSSQAK